MIPPFQPGINASIVTTHRLATRMLAVNPGAERVVLFLHGNLSNATWWETTLATLPRSIGGLAIDQRGFGDADSSRLIDATGGMTELADDAVALLDTLHLRQVDVVGNSLGGSVIWGMLARHPKRVRSAVLVNPGSPYGFGGTSGADAKAIHSDFAGSGAGLVSPELVDALRKGDTSDSRPASPRRVFRDLIVGRPAPISDEDAYVNAMFTVHLGERAYPGDQESSPNWPHVAPGKWGAANALSPKYSHEAEVILTHRDRPHITWIRGDRDLIVSDAGPLDPGVWGASGIVPGFQGNATYPPQPMVSQTREFLDSYRDTGGSYEEIILADRGHAPYIEEPAEFVSALLAQLNRNRNK